MAEREREDEEEVQRAPDSGAGVRPAASSAPAAPLPAAAGSGVKVNAKAVVAEEVAATAVHAAARIMARTAAEESTHGAAQATEAPDEQGEAEEAASALSLLERFVSATDSWTNKSSLSAAEGVGSAVVVPTALEVLLLTRAA